jgi:O-succinylbenzoic acid--CoA ligase
VAAALDGAGPPVLPVPVGNRAETAAVLAMARLDAPLGEADGLDEAQAGDVVLVVPTSGSTGPPKGALLTRAALTHSHAAASERLGGPGRWLLALPTTHVAGLQVVVRALLAGHPPAVVDRSGTFLPDRFAAATRALLATRTGPGTGSGPAYTSLVPTQLARLLDAGGEAVDALRAFTAVLVGAAASPPALLARAADAGVHVVTTYGMTETCGGCVYDGLPLSGVHVAVGAERTGAGRIRLGGPVVFAGYRARPELTALARSVDQQGVAWHLSRDVGRWDPTTGQLTVLGRVDDVITTGGEHVTPRLVEDARTQLPEIAEAAVVGVPDDVWGERVVALVVPTDPARPPTLGQVRACLTGTLPDPARPTALATLPQLPLLASGKPDRARLRALAVEVTRPSGQPPRAPDQVDSTSGTRMPG